MAKSALLSCILTIVLAVCTAPAAAHVFWIAPQDYTPRPGEQIVASLKTGQMLKGMDYPYLSDRFQSFTITTRAGTQNAKGFDGDIPALGYVAHEPGLNIIAFHSTPLRVTYVTFEQFAKYLDFEGLPGIAAAHKARGLPKSGFTERYIRYAKALVQVGPPGQKDEDRPLGLQFELVAKANPYAPGIDKLPVVLLWRGKPFADHQIAIYRDDGKVTRSLVFTDNAGKAMIPLTSGGEFVLNAVMIEPIKDGKTVWQSHWASLSFKLPPRD